MRDDFDLPGDHALLAAQLHAIQGYDQLSGEARLALAVVEDAITTVRMTTGVQTPRARRLAIEAWSWLASRDRSHPFAFENLCDHLGLDAGWLRHGLRRAGHGLDCEALAAASRRIRHDRRAANSLAV